MALGLAWAFLAFWIYTRPGKVSNVLPSLASGGTAHGCTGDDGAVGGSGGYEEVVQLISPVDSQFRPGGSSESRKKMTGARAEARAVGTTKHLAPEVPLK